ncbi:patatin-like phospholipase family protein [Gaetbulibacter aestuarii]|uniref:Patatin-like phospholipase family protein n=1 Tax=Gaetbulibacter aestuarii TaxID=1502358 RepID=A0ABW7MVN1_9FLAO
MNKKLLLTLICLFVLFSAKAQDRTEDARPKVGLVLSGGGAKGLAHIGVLKVIDSLGIKIDYVAGTSMGAIIGGLYASGYSGKQLDSIFEVVDFDKIISDDLPREAKAFYERDNSEKYTITLPFEGFKLNLPSALSRGQNTYNLLSKLTLPVNNIKEFKNLPIPYFCIATNVETGKEVVLDHGSLAQSMMASGALPSLFQPVTINQDVLIDGGVLNNYPIDELRAKGMDIIIGVDVQAGLRTRDELKSAPEILLQINNFRTIKAMDSKTKETDIYIKPQVKEYTVISFDAGAEIIKNGLEAALKNEPELDALPKLGKPRRLIKPIDSLRINRISFKGASHYSRAYLLGKLKLKPGEKVSYNQVEKGVNSLVGTNNFDAFEYDLKPSDSMSGYDFHGFVRESKITTFLKLGVHYDQLYRSAALINLTKKRLFFSNDVASLDFILGDNVRYNFDYLIDKGFYWSIGVRSRYNQFKKNVSARLLLTDAEIGNSDINKLEVKLADQTNQFYLQTLFRKDFSLSLGAEHKRLKIISETLFAPNSNSKYEFENTDYISVFGNLKLDTYNNKYFPTRGVYFEGDLHWYVYGSSFNQDFKNFAIGKAEIGTAFGLSDKFAVNLETSGGFKIGDKSTQTLDFALGGYGANFINNFVPFIGYDFISLTGNSYVKASAVLDYELFKKHHVTMEANWANVADDIFDTGEWFTLPDYRGYGLGYAVDTFFGPVQAKFSYSPERKKSIFFINVGFWF